MVLENSADFKHILRILNTNIEGKRKVPYGLRSIKGIGRRFAVAICKVARIDVNKRFFIQKEQENLPKKKSKQFKI